MSLRVGKAAVLGAGVMGAQIAAHMVNADIPVILFDLTAKESDPSEVAKRAIENLKKTVTAAVRHARPSRLY